MASSGDMAVSVGNAAGRSPFVLLCDHASNCIPARYGDMGLTPAERVSHIAWDPGALQLSFALSERLDAPLVYSTVSRLIIDTNRAADAASAIWTLSEATRIAANENLDETERRLRVETVHRPYHEAIEALLDARRAAATPTVIVCVHSFTPVYLGVERPWPIGLIHGRDEAFTRALRDALLERDASLNIGWNEPYAAMNGVTHTLEEHGDRRGLPATMIEVRNSEIVTEDGVALWADHLAQALARALEAVSAPVAGRPAVAGTSPGGR